MTGRVRRRQPAALLVLVLIALAGAFAHAEVPIAGNDASAQTERHAEPATLQADHASKSAAASHVVQTDAGVAANAAQAPELECGANDVTELQLNKTVGCQVMRARCR